MDLLKFSASLLILSVILYNAEAQSPMYDVIDTSHANVLGIELGTTEEELFNRLGNPDSTSVSFDPIVHEDTIKANYYNQSKLVTQSGKAIEISIKDDIYPLSHQGVKAGDSLSDIKDIFPKSYHHVDSSKDLTRKVLTIYTGDLASDIIYDKEIQLLFIDETLERIAIWTPL